MHLNQSTPGTFAAFKAGKCDAPDLIVLEKSKALESVRFNPIEVDPELDELIRANYSPEFYHNPIADWICSYYSEKKGKIMRVEMFDFELIPKASGTGLHDPASISSLSPGSVVRSRFFNCPYVFTMLAESEKGFWIASYWDASLESFRKIRLHVNEITNP